jgi:hypothetical protein
LREDQKERGVAFSGLAEAGFLIGALSVKLEMKMPFSSFFCQRSLSATWP